MCWKNAWNHINSLEQIRVMSVKNRKSIKMPLDSEGFFEHERITEGY